MVQDVQNVEHQLDALKLKRSLEVIPQRHTTVRCDICGDEDVKGICHHCHRYLCSRHIARPHFYEEPSWEFKGLTPDWRKAVHCEDHRHFVFAYRRMIFWPAIIAALVTTLIFLTHFSTLVDFLSRLTQDVSTYAVWAAWAALLRYQGAGDLVFSTALEILRPSLVSALIGLMLLAIAALGEWAYRKHGVPSPQKQGPDPTLIPLLPKRYRVLIEESAEARLEANWPDPAFTLQPLSGQVEVQVALGKDDELTARNAFFSKWGGSGTLSSGYVALDMPSGASLDMGTNAKIVEGRPWNLMLATRGHFPEPERWTPVVTKPYTLSADLVRNPYAGAKENALRVLPVLKPFSAGRTIMILFGFAPPWADRVWNLRHLTSEALTPALFSETGVVFPVETVNGRIDRRSMKVYWNNWTLSPKLQRWPTLTFTRPVTELRQPFSLYFELESDAPLSALRVGADRIWLPTGNPIASETLVQQPRSRITGELQIHPEFFAYTREFVTESLTGTVETAALDPARFSAVLQSLSEKHYLTVYSLIQSTPMISPQNNAIRKQWDVWGRYYVEFYPVDMHLILSSEQRLGETGTQVKFSVTCRALDDRQVEHLSAMSQQVEEHAVVLSQNVRDELIALLQSD
jgi:hypothetical protein